MALLVEQTLCIPARATSFTAVCDACAQAQIASRGYVGATVSATLPLAAAHGSVECERGHRIRVVRAVPENLGR